jgi:hypothetical protein
MVPRRPHSSSLVLLGLVARRGRAGRAAANDLFARAGLSARRQATGTTLEATKETGAQPRRRHRRPLVWYAWTAPRAACS